MAVFKKVELIGTSKKSIEDAIEKAVDKASGTIRNMSWFELQEVRGRIDGGKVVEYQTIIKVGFKLES